MQPINGIKMEIDEYAGRKRFENRKCYKFKRNVTSSLLTPF